MGSVVRVITVPIAVIGSALAALWAAVNPVVVTLASVTALIMGGTQHPLVGFGPLAETNSAVGNYLDLITDNYINFTVPGGTTVNDVAVYTPEEFWPAYGTRTFDESVAIGIANLSACLAGGTCPRNEAFGTPSAGDTFVVFGYSQSGRIVTNVKRSLIDAYSNLGWDQAPDASFIIVGNPDRPNGGLLERFAGLWIPFLNVTFDGATPTNSCDSAGCHLPTTDIAYQYDGFADFPSHPLNLLADLNALLGIAFNHGSYPDHPLTDAVSQGTYGDTSYYMIPATTLPLLQPISWLMPDALVALLDAPLRTIIEMGYDRSVSPGVPVTAQLFRFSPVRDLITIGIAVATGIDDALSMVFGNPDFRPLGTKPAGMYGVPEFKWSDLFGAPTAVAPEKIAPAETDRVAAVAAPATVAALSAGDGGTAPEAPATTTESKPTADPAPTTDPTPTADPTPSAEPTPSQDPEPTEEPTEEPSEEPKPSEDPKPSEEPTVDAEPTEPADEDTAATHEPAAPSADTDAGDGTKNVKDAGSSDEHQAAASQPSAAGDSADAK